MLSNNPSSGGEFSREGISPSASVTLSELLSADRSPADLRDALKSRPFTLTVNDLLPLFKAGEEVRKVTSPTNRSLEFSVFLIEGANRLTDPHHAPARDAMLRAIEPADSYFAMTTRSVDTPTPYREVITALRAAATSEGGSEALAALKITFREWLATTRSFARHPEAKTPIKTVANTSHFAQQAINDCFNNMLMAAQDLIEHGFNHSF